MSNLFQTHLYKRFIKYSLIRLTPEKLQKALKLRDVLEPDNIRWSASWKSKKSGMKRKEKKNIFDFNSRKMAMDETRRFFSLSFFFFFSRCPDNTLICYMLLQCWFFVHNELPKNKTLLNSQGRERGLLRNFREKFTILLYFHLFASNFESSFTPSQFFPITFPCVTNG